MNRRITGLLVAAIAVVTSVIVVLRAEKPRHYLQAHFERMRSVLPEPQQVRRSAQQIATQVSHLATDAKGTTEQTIHKVKLTGSDLAEKAKQFTTVGSQNGR